MVFCLCSGSLHLLHVYRLIFIQLMLQWTWEYSRRRLCVAQNGVLAWRVTVAEQARNAIGRGMVGLHIGLRHLVVCRICAQEVLNLYNI